MKKDITYDELLAKIPNKYILTIIAGERARERAKENLYHLQNMTRKILKWKKCSKKY